MSSQKRVDALFTALANTFFEKFTGRFPTVQALEIAKRLWANKLQHVSDHQIKYALEQCDRWTKDFAPDWPQFLELCHQAPRDPASYSDEPALKYIPVCDMKTAEKNIDKLRQILGMQPKYSQGK
jgi:hypothetical protein